MTDETEDQKPGKMLPWAERPIYVYQRMGTPDEPLFIAEIQGAPVQVRATKALKARRLMEEFRQEQIAKRARADAALKARLDAAAKARADRAAARLRDTPKTEQ